MQSKRAYIGAFFVLFIVTIILAIAILLFAFFAPIFVGISNAKTGTEVVSLLDFEVESLKRVHKAGAFSILNDQECKRGEALVLKGPYKGSCVCDSSPEGYYYYSKGKRPFTWFFPPCERNPKLTGARSRPTDSTLELNDENRDDLGICVHYFSNRYFTELSTGKPNKLVKEIDDIFYSKMNPRGYVEKVYKIPKKDGDRVFTREACAMGSDKTGDRLVSPVDDVYMTYQIFYDYETAPRNLIQGFSYDVGYCFLFFKDGKIKDVTTQRQDCYDFFMREGGVDKDIRVTFFVIEENSDGSIFDPEPETEQEVESVAVERKGQIELQYTFDYNAEVRGDDLSEDYVRANCERYEDYDLTFITGTAQYSDDEPRLYSDGSVRYSNSKSRIPIACRRAREAMNPKAIFTFLEVYELVSGDDSKILDNGDVCCYLTEKGGGE